MWGSRVVPASGAGPLAAAAASLALLGIGSSPASGAAQAGGPLAIERVELAQPLRNLALTVETSRRWSPKDLTGHPRGPQSTGQRYLCLRLSSRRSSPKLLCVGKGTQRLGRSILRDGQAHARGSIPAQISWPNRRSVEIRFRPAAAGLRPGRFRWSVVSGWSGPPCLVEGETPETPQPPPEEPSPSDSGARGRDGGPFGATVGLPCHSVRPRTKPSFSGRVLRVRAGGCESGKQGLVYHGSRNRKLIALTFDDGPSSYTESIVRALDRKQAKGTFFVLGSLVRSRAALMQRAVAHGHEIANHTWNHSAYPGSGDLRATNNAIRDATGYSPCSFRPPFGSFNSVTVAAAGSQGLSTVIWDVDTRDWTGLSSGSIHSAAVGPAQPGSIVLMHDGGGPRGQTAGAVSRIVATLRSRGYRLVTVSRLLGGGPTYEKVRARPRRRPPTALFPTPDLLVPGDSGVPAP